MSDVMLHGVLNMPLPDDPAECDFMTWMQFKQRARQASARIEELEAQLAKAVEALEWCATHRKKCHEYDDDVGHERRTFDVEDMIIMEYAARTTLAELKGQDDENMHR